jgi:hypothetical protein
VGGAQGSKEHACKESVGKLLDAGGGAVGFADEGLAVQADGIGAGEVWAGRDDGLAALEQLGVGGSGRGLLGGVGGVGLGLRVRGTDESPDRKTAAQSCVGQQTRVRLKSGGLFFPFSFGGPPNVRQKPSGSPLRGVSGVLARYLRLVGGSSSAGQRR